MQKAFSFRKNNKFLTFYPIIILKYDNIILKYDKNSTNKGFKQRQLFT